MPGNLILHHTHESGVISYDVSVIREVREKVALCERYWYDTKGCWQLWDGEFIEIHVAEIVVHPLKLIKQKIPKDVLKSLSID